MEHNVYWYGHMAQVTMDTKKASVLRVLQAKQRSEQSKVNL